MEIRNCKRCGRIFGYNGIEVCNHCFQNEQEDFAKVRDYLYQHPYSTVPEVNAATGVDLRVISRFMREGRIETTDPKRSEF